jgi:hypothetical protein
MRTLKNLAAVGALLLVASGANAAVSFTLTALNNGGPQEVDVSLTLSGGTGNAIIAFAFDWLLDGANVPLSAVQQPASAGTGPNLACDGVSNQFMCAFGAATVVGSAGSNSIGDGWTWDFTGPVADGVYNLGRFTFTDLTGGLVSAGNCEILDGSLNTIPCSSNSAAIVAVPEPTTAALLGLGLFGLVMSGGRRR